MSVCVCCAAAAADTTMSSATVIAPPASDDTEHRGCVVRLPEDDMSRSLNLQFNSRHRSFFPQHVPATPVPTSRPADPCATDRSPPAPHSAANSAVYICMWTYRVPVAMFVRSVRRVASVCRRQFAFRKLLFSSRETIWRRRRLLRVSTLFIDASVATHHCQCIAAFSYAGPLAWNALYSHQSRHGIAGFRSSVIV